MRMNIDNKNYKTYTLNDNITYIMFYNGCFYTSTGNIKITCYNKNFEKLWDLASSDNTVELAKILNNRIYYYTFCNENNKKLLMSVDLNGKNPKEEIKVNKIVYGNFEFLEENNQKYIYDIKSKKKYECPEIKPDLYYIPSKKK
ncbi:hypothetical protein PL321_02720 [Caloramator sp. mosi_1]|uniref:hypothetical protein n=1 Tax=Caloramator sp. mosi_1 TaxID=3023090 RepID=UPI002361826E|nr:hypothetical protein [Caloramator sp. mosi_1]WDC84636.1 hypothetical protein PL321_02720 [Caloramator sp. mosi_1]